MPTVIDVASLGIGGFRISGAGAFNFVGSDVAGLADVNGDGLDDIIVTDPLNTYDNVGGAYVIYGRTSGFSNIDLGNFGASDGFRINGDLLGFGLGSAVAGPGDINDDGFNDIAVLGSRNLGRFEINSELQTYVIFGGPARSQTLNISVLSLSDGVQMSGPRVFDRRSVASAGDVNRDGFDDLIVGARESGSPGKAIVIFGRSTGFENFNASDLGSNGFAILSDDRQDSIWNVSGAGDFNGDGFDDLVVGAFAAFYVNAEPAAYVIFGRACGLRHVRGSGE